MDIDNDPAHAQSSSAAIRPRPQPPFVSVSVGAQASAFLNAAQVHDDRRSVRRRLNEGTEAASAESIVHRPVTMPSNSGMHHWPGDAGLWDMGGNPGMTPPNSSSSMGAALPIRVQPLASSLVHTQVASSLPAPPVRPAPRPARLIPTAASASRPPRIVPAAVSIAPAGPPAPPAPLAPAAPAVPIVSNAAPTAATTPAREVLPAQTRVL